MTREKPPARTWTPEDVTRQERALEARVGAAEREFRRVQEWRRAELLALRKFRKNKIKYADRIMPAMVS
jgi:transposase